MRKLLIALVVLAAPVAAEDKPVPSPIEIVAAAPKGDWVAIAPTDLLVMDLAPDSKGKPRRVVIQLMPAPFSQGWIGNIRKLAAARWWDGLSINRVQDNYVVQWGDGEAEDKAKAKPLPERLTRVPETDYVATYGELNIKEVPPETGLYLSPIGGGPARFFASRETVQSDLYAPIAIFHKGWPAALMRDHETRVLKTLIWPVHCYGMIGVGRDMPPDTGSGAELYAVIGHAPRHLDRNIALVGRVIEGIEHLSSLPRGTGALGFYESAEERTAIQSIRLASDLPGDKPLPAYEYLSTESVSFAAYAEARANRRDAFFIRPAGGADICNIPVPVRRVN
jgi:cyclophilin family peptidyl-prolyl cis-trans isomerase